MAARIDPFVDVLLREKGDQLYLLPDEPVTMVKDGKPRKVSKQPLTDQHIYALLVEVAPSEAADHIDQVAETQFEYAADRGLVLVRIVPDMGRLTAVVAPVERAATPAGAGAAAAPARAPRRAPAPPKPPRHSAIASAAMVDAPVPPGAGAPAPAARRAPAVAEAPAAASPDQPAERALGELLRALVESGSSDLHLRVGEPPVFRTHGEIERQAGPPLVQDRLEQMLFAVLPERSRAEWTETGDADFAYEIPGVARFRVNAGRDRKGPMAVFRAIPAEVTTAERLGLSKEVQQLSHLSKGMVLVTGPAGSGKSTTLSALIDLINSTRPGHIVTIEEPIEFVHESKQCIVTQRQVGVHTDSFKSALRAALREDLDVLLVGEMRDAETLASAIEIAEAGHLVLGTQHTTTAVATLDRIVSQFPADRQAQIRVLLSESLKGVIAQTLCKKIDGGRVAAREVLLVTPAIANLIREGKTVQIPSIIQTSKQLGMMTLNDALSELVEHKQISPDEAYLRSADKGGLAAWLKAKGHAVTHSA